MVKSYVFATIPKTLCGTVHSTERRWRSFVTSDFLSRGSLTSRPKRHCWRDFMKLVCNLCSLEQWNQWYKCAHVLSWCSGHECFQFEKNRTDLELLCHHVPSTADQPHLHQVVYSVLVTCQSKAITLSIGSQYE